MPSMRSVCRPPTKAPFYFYMFVGLAHYARQDYEAAARWGRLSLSENPSYISSMKVLIAALSALRQDEEARQVAHSFWRSIRSSDCLSSRALCSLSDRRRSSGVTSSIWLVLGFPREQW